jgi:hypothetical protein
MATWCLKLLLWALVKRVNRRMVMRPVKLKYSICEV